MILFLNHTTENCGVYQLGKRVGITLEGYALPRVLYCELEAEWEYEALIQEYQPHLIVYNYYPSTMPWLNHFVLQRHPDIAHACIFHEVPTEIFDCYIHIDPSFEEHGKHFSIGRIIPDYTNTFPAPEKITIGTFGFGLGGKDYHSLVGKVNAEFDEAVVRLHVPYAHFGDADGQGAGHWVELCRRSITKPGIELEVSHDFLPEEELLDFLAQNTINAFHYAVEGMHGRGIASVTDYALAVDRPIAITKSYMFRHMHPLAPEICMENHSLREIVAFGTTPLQRFQAWDKYRLVEEFRRIHDSIQNTRTV